MEGSKGDHGSRVLVIGAGPAGLATAACLGRKGILAHLVDRNGMVGGAYQRIYPATVLLSVARHHGLPGLELSPGGQYTSVDEYLKYLEKYASHHGLVPDRAKVERIERTSDRFRVQFRDIDSSRDYVAVVVATGMYDNPVWPETPGLLRVAPPPHGSPRVLHSQSWPGPGAIAGQRLLIIGGGTSAVEIAEQCAREQVRVVLASRHRVRPMPKRLFGADLHGLAYPLTSRLPRWLLGAYCARQLSLPGTDRGFRRFQRDGLIIVRGPVNQFEGSHAVFADGAREPFDTVVLATGYHFTTPFLPEEVAPMSSRGRFTDEGESRSWPGLYFVGLRCARTLSSEFLRGIACDAPIVASRIYERLAQGSRGGTPLRYSVSPARDVRKIQEKSPVLAGHNQYVGGRQ